LPSARVVELAFDAVVARDLVALGDIRVPRLNARPFGELRALRMVLHLARAAAVHDGIHVLRQAVADEHRAFSPRASERASGMLRPRLRP